MKWGHEQEHLLTHQATAACWFLPPKPESRRRIDSQGRPRSRGSRSRVESGFFTPGQCVTGWAVIKMTGHQEIDQVVLALSAERVTIIAAIAKTTVTHFKHKVDTNV